MLRRVSALILLLVTVYPWPASYATSFSYGAWIPYWEKDKALEEARAISSGLDSIVAFMCLFDTEDRLTMPEETEEILFELMSLSSRHGKVFLSVVNDAERVSGGYENKSTALLSRLFSTQEQQRRHIVQLLSLIDQYKPDGLELDYENIRKDRALWSSYMKLVEALWTVCQQESIRLRVVLPWDAPRYTTLPQGPEYVVMCYNLYGTHSGPGPKADYTFLRTVCELYRVVPGSVRMAFATGGFEWTGKKVLARTQRQSEERLASVGVTPERDPESGVLHACFMEDGALCDLWYADGTTLALWRDLCAEYGYTSFDLFRLGGNDLSDMEDSIWQALERR